MIFFVLEIFIPENRIPLLFLRLFPGCAEVLHLRSAKGIMEISGSLRII